MRGNNTTIENPMLISWVGCACFKPGFQSQTLVYPALHPLDPTPWLEARDFPPFRYFADPESNHSQHNIWASLPSRQHHRPNPRKSNDQQKRKSKNLTSSPSFSESSELESSLAFLCPTVSRRRFPRSCAKQKIVSLPTLKTLRRSRNPSPEVDLQKQLPRY